MVRAWAGPLPPCVPRRFLIPAASQGRRKWGQEHFRVCVGRPRQGSATAKAGAGEAFEVLVRPRGHPCSSPCPLSLLCLTARLSSLEAARHRTKGVQPERQAREERQIFSQRKCCGFETFISHLWLAFPRVLRGEGRVSPMSPNKVHQ